MALMLSHLEYLDDVGMAAIGLWLLPQYGTAPSRPVPHAPPARIIFKATSRLAATCLALYTTPIPPLPSSPSIS